MFHLFPEDEESVLVKPRARSTASGKKIPAGAVSIFGGEFYDEHVQLYLWEVHVDVHVVS